MVNEFPLTDNQLKTHKHNGLDSLKISARDLENAPQPAISNPTGGVTIDANARAAIVSIITTLENLGLIKE